MEILEGDVSYQVLLHENGEHTKVPIRAWINGVQLEDEAYKQLIKVRPTLHRHLQE
jgi:hypothetical protein